MIDVDKLSRTTSWDGVSALVAGMGQTGFAAADNLTHLGASVTALDELDDGDRVERATLLEILGAHVRLGEGAAASFPDDIDLLIASADTPPDAPLIVQARDRDVPVWGEVELAWRLRDLERRTPWLAVTGTRGTTETTRMLEAVLRAEGLRTVTCGRSGLPLTEVVMDPMAYDVLAVELSASQLHYVSTMHAESAVVINLGHEDLGWYPTPDAYAADAGRIYEGVERACVYNVADGATRRLVEEAEVVEGARAIGFTLGVPEVGMVGLVDDILADRAFVEQRQHAAAELCSVADLYSDDPWAVANALAAASLARSHGVSATSVREGLRGYVPE